MAYNRRNNYNNNRGKGGNINSRYYGGNTDRREIQAAMGFDARRFKKRDIELTDLNGKTYIISGNFVSTFAVEMANDIEKVEKYKEGQSDFHDIPEMVEILKDWCLRLLNHNIEGKVYDMTAVNSGFNDIDVLYNMFKYIAEIIDNYGKKTVNAKVGGGND